MKRVNEFGRSYEEEHDGGKVSYLCDVEGNWEYFCRFVDMSEALSFADGSDGLAATGPKDLVLKEDFHFVFGVGRGVELTLMLVCREMLATKGMAHFALFRL